LSEYRLILIGLKVPNYLETWGYYLSFPPQGHIYYHYLFTPLLVIFLRESIYSGRGGDFSFEIYYGIDRLA